MAKEDVEDVEEEVQAATAKEKKYDTGSASLEKVTDFAEEKELKGENLSSVQKILGIWFGLNPSLPFSRASVDL